MPRALVAVALLSLAVGSVDTLAQNRRVVPSIDQQSPSSLADVADKSQVIVVGVVVGRQQTKREDGDRVLPVVRHTVQVMTPIKGPASLSAKHPITVFQTGGSVVARGVEIYVDDRANPVWDTGETILMFLTHSSAAGGYVPTFDSGGSYVVTNGKVTIPTHARGLPELTGKRQVPIADFTSLIKSFGASPLP